jgi:DNA transformation protein and related proteins
MAEKKPHPARLMNIGPVSTGWLNEAGIHTQEDLEALGAVEAYRRVKALHPDKVSLNLLYGLEAALTKRRWNSLSPEEKAALRAEAEKR